MLRPTPTTLGICINAFPIGTVNLGNVSYSRAFCIEGEMEWIKKNPFVCPLAWSFSPRTPCQVLHVEVLAAAAEVRARSSSRCLVRPHDQSRRRDGDREGHPGHLAHPHSTPSPAPGPRCAFVGACGCPRPLPRTECCRAILRRVERRAERRRAPPSPTGAAADWRFLRHPRSDSPPHAVILSFARGPIDAFANVGICQQVCIHCARKAQFNLARLHKPAEFSDFF
jgi:hypothetical protein